RAASSIFSVLSSVTVLAVATSSTVHVSRHSLPTRRSSDLATGWASSTLDLDVVTPTFRFVHSDCCFDLPTSRTTASAPHALAVGTNTPGCGFECDSPNVDITVSFAVTGTPAGIVTITPASVTLHQNRPR